jgi:hypothetical protein
MRELESMNVSFAFPTMTLNLSKNAELKMRLPEGALSPSLQ